MQCEVIRVRRLDVEEIKSLTPDDEIYVPSSDFEAILLVPARAKGNAEAYWANEKLHVRSITNTEFFVKFDRVFVTDENGEEYPLMPFAGTQVSMTLFVPVHEDAKNVVYQALKAAREEFGTGEIEVWNYREKPVPDIRWDVYAVRNGLVGKGKNATWQEVERKLLASGVRDGHQQFFMGQAEPGWHIVIQPHTGAAHTETI